MTADGQTLTTIAGRRAPEVVSRLVGRVPGLLRQAGVYTVSQLLSRVTPFLLLPVLTRYLSPADYGIVAMFLLVATLVDPFVGLGFAGAITVKYYDTDTDLPAYFSTGTVAVVVAALVFGIVIAVLHEPLSVLTQVPPEWLMVVVPVIVARNVVGGFLALLRVRGRALFYGVFQNLQSATLLTIAIVLVVGMGAGWTGRAAAEFVGWALFAVIALSWLWRHRWLRPAFVRSYASSLLRFGMPLIPHSLGAALMVQTDRLLLTNLVGVDQTGLYTAGYQLALVIELFAVSFNNAYTPWLFERLGSADNALKRRLVRITYAQFAAMAAIALLVAVAMPWVAERLLGSRFSGAGVFVPWFAVGFLFSGMYYMVTNYIFYMQRTAWLAAGTITVGVLNIPLTYVLITWNGAIGAAQAMAISFALSFLVTWAVSQRVYPMPWRHFRTPTLVDGTPE